MADYQRCRMPERRDRDKDLAKVCEDFDQKVSFNFRRFVFLFPPPQLLGLDVAVRLASSCEGYEAHRVVYCKERASHMHIRYTTEEHAKKAIENIQRNPGLVAGKVYDLLKMLYVVERSCKFLPSWTLAIVDIDGVVEHTNPLSKDVLDSLLQKFGKPHIFSYRTEHKVDHVQVLFSSMAETLGACIAHGRWYKGYELESMRFRYRIKLVGSDKESLILKESCAFDPDYGAYDLDYFVGTNSAEAYKIAPDNLQNTIPSNSFCSPSETPVQGTEIEYERSHRREFTSSNRRTNKPHRGRNSSRGRNSGTEYSHSRHQSSTFTEHAHTAWGYDLEHKFRMGFSNMPN